VVKFPHVTDYIINVAVSPDNQLTINCGNNQGAIFTYKVDPNQTQVLDENNNV